MAPPIQKFRTDNARDYFNNHLHQFFQQEGIVHKSSCIDTPQQNRATEQKMRHLLNVARTLLHHHHVPKHFWGEAILPTTYVINRVLSRVLSNQSPFQCLASFFPNLSLHSPLPLKVFESVCFVHIPKAHWDNLILELINVSSLGTLLPKKAINVTTLPYASSMSPKMSPLLSLSHFLVLFKLDCRGRLYEMRI